MLEYSGAPAAEIKNFVDLWPLASAVPDTIVRFVTALPIFDLIWGWIQKLQ